MIPKNAQMWTPDQLEDFRLWDEWDKAGRKKQQLRPLLRRLDPLIAKKFNPFSTVPNMPQSAIRAEFKKHAVAALHKFDPNRGVPLGHHVMRQMDGAKRFVYDHQNIARIPAHRARKGSRDPKVSPAQQAPADRQARPDPTARKTPGLSSATAALHPAQTSSVLPTIRHSRSK